MSEKQFPPVALLGFGESNRGVYRTLSALGYTDFRLYARERPKDCPPIPATFGADCFGRIAEPLLFRSPAVHPASFSHEGKTVRSDAEYYFSHTHAVPIGVTGSDGKSTTVSMCAHILACAGLPVRLGGNIGRALSPFLVQEEREEDTQYTVAELSSFQLADFAPLCERAVITNVSENHLNWHTDMRDYVHAKANIYLHTKHPVLYAPDPMCRLALTDRTAFVAVSDRGRAPLSDVRAEHTLVREGGCVYLDGARYFDTDALPFRGCTLTDVLFALALTLDLVDRGSAVSALRSFRKLPHRAETVGWAGGVRFVDSSVDSTPTRTATTLSSVSSPTVLLLGGEGKGASALPLVSAIARCCSAVVLWGEVGALADGALSAAGSQIPRFRVSSMREGLPLAVSLARPGDTVLLSPAAASFDEFENYAERAAVFASYVRSLAGFVPEKKG